MCVYIYICIQNVIYTHTPTVMFTYAIQVVVSASTERTECLYLAEVGVSWHWGTAGGVVKGVREVCLNIGDTEIQGLTIYFYVSCWQHGLQHILFFVP